MSRGFLSGGLCPGGFCPGGVCPDTRVNTWFRAGKKQIENAKLDQASSIKEKLVFQETNVQTRDLQENISCIFVLETWAFILTVIGNN